MLKNYVPTLIYVSIFSIISILVLSQEKVQVKHELHLNILNYVVSISSFLNSFQYFFPCPFGVL